MEPNGEPKQVHPYVNPERGSAGAAGPWVRDNPSISGSGAWASVWMRGSIYCLSLTLSVNEILLSISFLWDAPSEKHWRKLETFFFCISYSNGIITVAGNKVICSCFRTRQHRKEGKCVVSCSIPTSAVGSITFYCLTDAILEASAGRVLGSFLLFR